MREFLYSVVEKSQDLLLFLQEDRIIYMNKCFCSAFGVDEDQVIRNQSLSFLHGSQELKWKETLSIVKTSDEEIVTEFIAELSTVQAVVRATFSRLGTYISCTWKFLQQEENMSSELYRLRWFDIINSNSELNWFCIEYDEQHGEIRTLFNSNASVRFLKRYGLDFYRFWNVHYNEDSVQQNAKFWVEKLKTLTIESPMRKFEYTEFLPHSDHIHIRAKIKLLHPSSTGNSRYIAMVENITEQTDIETELFHKKIQLAEMTEKLVVLKGFFDYSPIWLGTAKVVENKIIMGISNKPTGHTFADFTPEMSTLWIRKYFEAKETCRPTIFEYNLNIKGTTQYYSCCIVYLTGCEFAFSSQDITARFQLEKSHSTAELEETVRRRTKELETALQVKSRFLATMSHEIRTPLAGIISSLALIEGMNDEQTNLLRTGQVCADHLLVIINDVLDLSKMDENKMQLESVQFTVKSLLEESMEVVLFDAEKKNIELILDISPNIQDSQLGDPARLRQIVINLLSNAVKFSNRGEIILKATTNEIFENNKKMCELVISVKDEGIGIPEQARSKIFQPFTQADTSMSRRYGGSGLGLTISRRLAEMMNGSLQFQSVEGKGSTFYLNVKSPWLPVSISKQLIPCECQGKKIVVVCGNKTMSRILNDRLLYWGFSPIICEKEQIADYECDLILIDSSVGMDVIEQINKKPIFVMSYLPIHSKPQDFVLVKKPIREATLQSQLVKYFCKQTQEPELVKTPQIAPDHSKVKILIAEDNLMNQKIIRKLLNTFGFVNLETVENGKEAVDAVNNNFYDIILMDCMMPELSGIEATDIIRKTIPQSKQPKAIIALTADAFSETKVQCLKVGMQEVVTKPISHKLLRDVIERYVK